MKFHHYERVEPKILRKFIEASASTIDWLESLGFPYVGNGVMNFMADGKYPFGNFVRVTRRLTENLQKAGHTVLTNTGAVDILLDCCGTVRAVNAVKADGAVGKRPWRAFPRRDEYKKRND